MDPSQVRRILTGGEIKPLLLSPSSGTISTLSLKHSLGLWGRRHSTVITCDIDINTLSCTTTSTKFIHFVILFLTLLNIM